MVKVNRSTLCLLISVSILEFSKKKRSWIISDKVKMEKDYWELRWAVSITGLVRSQEITSVSCS